MLTALVWLYGISVLVLVILLHMVADRFWIATLLMFSPRWILCLPLALLVPAALLAHRRLLWPLLVTGLLLVGPLLGFDLPLRAFHGSGDGELRVLTCNLRSSNEPFDALLSALPELRPDVVALQECPADHVPLPAGWNVISEGSLLIASRYPIERSESRMARHPPHKYPRVSALQATIHLPDQGRALRFCCVHLPSPRYGLDEVLDRRTLIAPKRRGTLVEETANRSAVSREVAGAVRVDSMDVLIAGDFNMPVESTIYRRDWSNYRNAFSDAGLGLGWTFRAELRRLSVGTRIDHVLMSRDWRARRAWIGPDVGSDHRPLIVDLVRP
ncbi:MAG: endonuclease/exonuclease/phosphatase family protein [Candidatus Eisenbacteria bacterium]|nr:endonuclease/exonuclease/phosphatase family protein [Candidatus Eisenbacteria bacterium]